MSVAGSIMRRVHFMDYQTLDGLRHKHPGWLLLAATNAPLIIGFLHRTFIQPNVRTLAEQELTSKLDDYLFHLRESLGEQAFPRSAADYLRDWAADNTGWLRRYYPAGSDEPHYDLTPATEKAIEWLASLQQRPFVGTESRLRIVFDLLQQLVQGTQTDASIRIQELERRQAELAAELQRAREGDIPVMGPTQVKDRFQQAAATARGLLSDFREVEQNFRDLDRTVRERIATWDGAKGALLDEIFGERDAIGESDQGRSFRAFWDFLMSPARQEELSDLLTKVLALEPVRELRPDPRLRRVHFDWLEAGETAQRTVARLSAELRRFLDDQVWLENKRIMQVIREVEQHAIALRDTPPHGTFVEIDAPAPDVDLTMDRLLYSPPFKPRIPGGVLLEGDGVLDDCLFEQMYIDRAKLAEHVRRELQTRDQISLSQLLELYPLEQGLSELLVYLALATEDPRTVIDDHRTETVVWKGKVDQPLRATLPLVIWSR
jgi:flagellar motility protein MotE (MotC chaperone)